MKGLIGMAGVAAVGAVAYSITGDGESAFLAAALMFIFWSVVS